MVEAKSYERIISSHMHTLDRASERVNSWPQWKRDSIQYRTNECQSSEVVIREENAKKQLK
jgi:hypothetical protein